MADCHFTFHLNRRKPMAWFREFHGFPFRDGVEGLAQVVRVASEFLSQAGHPIIDAPAVNNASCFSITTTWGVTMALACLTSGVWDSSRRAGAGKITRVIFAAANGEVGITCTM